MTEKRIAICRNENGWHDRFMEALEPLVAATPGLACKVVDIDCDDWMARLEGCDVVVWKPNHMGVESASHFKEKIFVMEQFLGKLVIPNFKTVWHFESKVAQKYLMELHGIPTPRSVATFDYQDALALLADFSMPLVFKKSSGAASSNVSLVRSRNDAKRLLRNIFCRQASELVKEERGSLVGRYSPVNARAWLSRKSGGANQPVAYWQEFLPGNEGDLRITVIGNRYAFGFWRKNRPNDFRASGSGRIDYETTIPPEAIRYCLSISARLDFDSMAYDLLFTGSEFKVVEMSFGYVDHVVRNTPGYWELADDELIFRQGHYWPQQMWIRWTLARMQARGMLSCGEPALNEDQKS